MGFGSGSSNQSIRRWRAIYRLGWKYLANTSDCSPQFPGLPGWFLRFGRGRFRRIQIHIRRGRNKRNLGLKDRCAGSRCLCAAGGFFRGWSRLRLLLGNGRRNRLWCLLRNISVGWQQRIIVIYCPRGVFLHYRRLRLIGGGAWRHLGARAAGRCGFRGSLLR